MTLKTVGKKRRSLPETAYSPRGAHSVFKCICGRVFYMYKNINLYSDVFCAWDSWVNGYFVKDARKKRSRSKSDTEKGI